METEQQLLKMFPNSYFARRYFPDRYFPPGGIVVPPILGGVGVLAGGSQWDERFITPRLRREEELEDEDGLILAYWYAREHYML